MTKKTKKKITNKTIKITQVRSAIGRPENQKRILKGMGLGNLNRTVELPDTPESMGMVKKVIHLVRLEE